MLVSPHFIADGRDRRSEHERGLPQRRQAPRFGGLYWFRELLGRKRSDAPYLYLTDGGHFENLRIYELVARRCQST